MSRAAPDATDAAARARRSRRWLAPEVVQTSAMDCGPAVLKSLLEGYDLEVHLGRLREACQTAVDGTSIDALEAVAQRLGLDATQTIVPFDHLVLRQAAALPALAVTRRPGNSRHFVLVWRAHGPLVQLMDPVKGRRWVRREQLAQELYEHRQPIAAADFRAWAGGDEFVAPLRARLGALGCTPSRAAALLASALADPGWRAIAALDAAARMVGVLVRARSVAAGEGAARLLATLLERCRGATAAAPPAVPWDYWFARPAPPDARADADADAEQVVLCGAVIVAVHGRRDPGARGDAESDGAPDDEPAPVAWSPALEASLRQPTPASWRVLLRLLAADGWREPALLAIGFVLAACAAALEAVILRALFDIATVLALPAQRAAAVAALLVVMLAAAALEVPLLLGVQRVGRRVEAWLRLALFARIPRLDDAYVKSRATSDMAERAHSVHRVRQLAELLGELVRALAELAVVTAGLVWLDPPSAPLALALGALVVLVPLAIQQGLAERELQLRVHNAALSRFYLDGLLGAVPVRAHGAERALAREHEALLVNWVAAGRRLFDRVALLEGAQWLAGAALVIALLSRYAARAATEPAALLLFAFWALQVPACGRAFAAGMRQLPALRNTTLRVLEPLDALDGEPVAEPAREAPAQGAHVELAPRRAHGGVAVAFERVSVHAGGQRILRDLSLAIEPGTHVAVVGESGSGKSTLVGLLLGFYQPSGGVVRVDGEDLAEPERLAALRAQTAWVDPAAQLWNRALLDNVYYGHDRARAAPLGWVAEQAELWRLLESLPQGARTPLGEAGALVSGGEGQRVRLARALLRGDARLAVLDEPFRGLDRGQRAALLARTRTRWRGRTLVCVTHDVRETRGFDRVLVVARGRVREDGRPEALAARPGSLYRRLLEAETRVERALWAGETFRRYELRDGELRAAPPVAFDAVDEDEAPTQRLPPRAPPAATTSRDASAGWRPAVGARTGGAS